MTDFRDCDIIITGRFAAKLTRTGRGWFAEVAHARHHTRPNSTYMRGVHTGRRVHAVVMLRVRQYSTTCVIYPSYLRFARSPTMSIQKILGSPFLTMKLTKTFCFPKSAM